MNGKKIGFFLGLTAFVVMLIIPAPEGLPVSAWRVAAITVLMAIWWITEAIPIPATALLPIALYPILGVMSSAQSTLGYADHVIYLFMGGFFLAVTMERWNLHKRVALYTIRLVGASPSRMVLGFMSATALLSMWISNTATAVMMVPIGIAVISQITGLTKMEVNQGVEGKKYETNFAKSLMLGVAYAASIGGVATIIGTPPNTIMKGMMEKLYGLEISFVQWMYFGVPLSLIMLVIVWFLLTKVLFKTGDLSLMGSQELIDEEIEKLGHMTRPEKLTLMVGGLMAFSWIFREFLKKPDLYGWINNKIGLDLSFIGSFFGSMSDTTIAIAGAILLFMIPVDFKKGINLLDWKTAVKIPWDVVILFGGGLTLASGFEKTGLAVWIGGNLTSLEGVSMVIFILIVVAMTIFLTEITSNTATATLLVPIMGSAAIAMGVHPFATVVAACVAASYAFMLPVATPPNAVVFGSGYVRIKDMAYAGLWLNITGAVFIVLFVRYVMPIVWGVDIFVTPADLLLPMGE